MQQLVEVVAQLCGRQVGIGDRSGTAAHPERLPNTAPLDRSKNRGQVTGQAQVALFHSRDDLVGEPQAAVRLLIHDREAEVCCLPVQTGADERHHLLSPRRASGEAGHSGRPREHVY